MAKLVDCAGCGGLKRGDSARCPHCGRAAANGLRTAVAAVGFGALAACTGTVQEFPDPGDGGDAGQDGSVTCCDAYGLPPFFDAGVRDLRDGGDSD